MVYHIHVQLLHGSFKSDLQCVIHDGEAKNLRHNTKHLLSATVPAANFELKLLYENVKKIKNKHAAELLGTSNLSIKIVCSPPKSRDTVPLICCYFPATKSNPQTFDISALRNSFNRSRVVHAVLVFMKGTVNLSKCIVKTYFLQCSLHSIFFNAVYIYFEFYQTWGGGGITQIIYIYYICTFFLFINVHILSLQYNF